MFDIIKLNKECHYLDIIEVDGSMLTVRFTNVDDLSYFIEKFGEDGGQYDLIDDKTAYIEFY